MGFLFASLVFAFVQLVSFLSVKAVTSDDTQSQLIKSLMVVVFILSYFAFVTFATWQAILFVR